MDERAAVRSADLIRAARFKAAFTNFLTEEETEIYERALSHEGDIEPVVWGGYDDAERVIVGAAPKGFGLERADFDISCLYIKNNGAGELTHRDYLGSLMSLGVKRELVGDIITDTSGTFVFCTSLMGKLILNELIKVGNRGISVSAADPKDIRPRAPELIKKNVSSLRLDCIVAAIVNKNREYSQSLVAGGHVKLKHEICQKPAAIVDEGNVINIRGYGKYRMGKTTGRSAKDRLFIELYKY